MSQQVSLFPEPNIVLNIKPSNTDATIKDADTPHFIAYNPTIKQGNLLLFLPGTGGIASKGPKKLFSVALLQGYRVINLSYINTPAIAQVCRRKNLRDNADCAKEFREKRIFGTGNFSLIEDQKQDAIANRLTKLLVYLSKTDVDGNWSYYLNEDHKLDWDKIAVSGQSQGGGMAAFIAKRNLVARVIDFSGGWDYSKVNKIATWYNEKSITPPEVWYGTYHAKEANATTIRESYEAMKIPEDNIFVFDLEVPEGRRAHSNGVRNINYINYWIKALGKGN
ncbi:hypothetical protein N9V96_03525 [Polaribacter sp.]|nr:hypothetical protein [Polaribacter sp.]